MSDVRKPKDKKDNSRIDWSLFGGQRIPTDTDNWYETLRGILGMSPNELRGERNALNRAEIEGLAGKYPLPTSVASRKGATYIPSGFVSDRLPGEQHPPESRTQVGMSPEAKAQAAVEANDPSPIRDTIMGIINRGSKNLLRDMPEGIRDVFVRNGLLSETTNQQLHRASERRFGSGGEDRDMVQTGDVKAWMAPTGGKAAKPVVVPKLATPNPAATEPSFAGVGPPPRKPLPPGVTETVAKPQELRDLLFNKDGGFKSGIGDALVAMGLGLSQSKRQRGEGRFAAFARALTEGAAGGNAAMKASIAKEKQAALEERKVGATERAAKASETTAAAATENAATKRLEAIIAQGIAAGKSRKDIIVAATRAAGDLGQYNPNLDVGQTISTIYDTMINKAYGEKPEGKPTVKIVIPGKTVQ